MNGSILQLVSFGKEDEYLTSRPQISFFNIVFKRHTYFAIETMEQSLFGENNFGGTSICKISKNGDLLGPCFLKVTLPKINTKQEFQNYGLYYYHDTFENKSKWVNRVGFRLIKNIKLKIGSQIIDELYSTWMYVWAELFYNNNKKSMLDKMVGTKGSDGSRNGLNTNTTHDLQIPLMFSFFRHPSLYIPLLSLEYNDVEFQIEFETLENCYFVNNDNQRTTNNLSGNLSNVSLSCDYIFLDEEEKTNLKKYNYDYLIETLQSQENIKVNNGKNENIELDFYHPIKELFWIVRRNYSNNVGDKFTDFTNNASGITLASEGTIIDGSLDEDDIAFSLGKSGTLSNISFARIYLNEEARISERNNTYFNYIIPYQHHKSSPDLGINVYSFSLYPEEHQPSGVCNFSRLQKKSLSITSKTNGLLNIYALGYNVIRVKNGFGQLAYAK